MNDNNTPRELTKEEVQKRFLDTMWSYVGYWEHESRATTIHDKLTGLLHSILVVLDGGSGLPAFKVVPIPHPDDKEYCRQIGENWYPKNCDIAGGLHDIMYCYRNKK